MNLISDSYLERTDKKINKLTSRLFSVTPDERARLMKQINKLKTKRKEYQLNKARVRIPAELFKHKVKSHL